MDRTSGRRNLDTVGGDSPVARPRGCRPRGGYVAGYRAGVRHLRRYGSSAGSRGPGVRSVLRRGRVPGHECRPRLRHTRRVLQRPPTGTIPDAPALTSSGTGTAGSSTWARPSRCGAGSPTTSRTRPISRPGRPRWWPRPRPSSGSRSATTSRPSCSSTASSSSTSPASTCG